MVPYHSSFGLRRSDSPLDLRDDGEALGAVRVSVDLNGGGRRRGLEEGLGDLDAAIRRERRRIRVEERLGYLQA